MAKYRKNPMVVEAWLWDGRPETIYQIGMSGLLYNEMTQSGTMSAVYKWEIEVGEDGMDLVIKTIEGAMRANIGDYIIKGIHGEYYPCKPDIFKESYEEEN